MNLLSFSASNITGCWPFNLTASSCSYYDSLLHCSCSKSIRCSNISGPACLDDNYPPFYLCGTTQLPDPTFNCINGSWVSLSSIVINSEITFDGSIIVVGNITVSQTGTLVITENTVVQAENLIIQGGQLEISHIGDTSVINLSGCANIEEGNLLLTFIPTPEQTLISASCILGSGFSNVTITPLYDPNEPLCPVVMATSFQLFVITNCPAIGLADGRPQFNYWYIVIIMVSVVVLSIVIVVLVMKVEKCNNVVFPYYKRWKAEEEMKNKRQF